MKNEIEFNKVGKGFATASSVLMEAKSGDFTYQTFKIRALFIPDSKSRTYHHFTATLEIWKNLDKKAQNKHIISEKINGGSLTSIQLDKPEVLKKLKIFLEKCEKNIGKNFDEIDFVDEDLPSSNIQDFLKFYEKNKGRKEEEFWQKYFKENQQILSTIFSSPYIFFEDKPYCGGKTISNERGVIGDFLYKNPKTKSISFIEIKTPIAEIVSKYRSTYSASSHLSGGISQVLDQKTKLLKNLNLQNGLNCGGIKCILLIGDSGSLKDDEQREAFEIIRENSKNVDILTYDELFLKVESMKESLINKTKTQRVINLF